MADTTLDQAIIATADGVPLKVKLLRTTRLNRMKAFGLVVLFVAGFEQRTIPRQMWAGIREQISPTILAVATLLIIFSIVLMTALELLRRRNERLRGIRA